MINFMCASLSCIQNYLGVGYVTLQAADIILYTNYSSSKSYICNRQYELFSCRELIKNEY